MDQNTFSEAEALDTVTDIYRTILGREPDLPGLQHYAGELLAGARLDIIRQIFLDSDEYRKRLERLFPHILREPLSLAQKFPPDYAPAGEAGRGYLGRLQSGFFEKYCSGSIILDVGYTGYDNPQRKAALPHALGIDLDFPGYDGRRLPFADRTVDTVFSSHCLEHILYDHAAIRDWYRVLKVGGFIVCMVPSQSLYEKRRFLPSCWNGDHKRMYTPSSLALSFETALDVNSYRIRHLAENDRGFNYALGPDQHSKGCYEIEIVVERIVPPDWGLQ
jgi:SAM-dependent methyltransferase